MKVTGDTPAHDRTAFAGICDDFVGCASVCDSNEPCRICVESMAHVSFGYDAVVSMLFSCDPTIVPCDFRVRNTVP
jgi:hypothetical protein